MLSLLIALLGVQDQTPPTEADYHEAVRCTSAAAISSLLASNMAGGEHNPVAVDYEEKEGTLLIQTMQIGAFGGISSREVEETVEASRWARMQTMMALPTPEALATFQSETFKETDDCTGTRTYALSR